MFDGGVGRDLLGNKWPLVGGDWLIARSTHPDQLDQLRSPPGGIWEDIMAGTCASWSFFSVSAISKIHLSSFSQYFSDV